jgi:hypothetical protein
VRFYLSVPLELVQFTGEHNSDWAAINFELTTRDRKQVGFPIKDIKMKEAAH